MVKKTKNLVIDGGIIDDRVFIFWVKYPINVQAALTSVLIYVL